MPRCLLIDLGNSRLKWALASGDRISRQHAVAHDGRWTQALALALEPAVNAAGAARCVSVAPAAMTRSLAAWLRRHGLRVQLLRSQRLQRGLRNGYRDPWRLGADRWAAMLAVRAFSTAARSWLIVSAGTAVTADLLDSSGQHRGGVIVPGRRLMARSLLVDTAGIARRARVAARSRRARPRGGVFARNTALALQSGALVATVALIEKLRVEARRELGHYPVVVLTGGDAPALALNLTCKSLLVPNLVLRGLLAAF